MIRKIASEMADLLAVLIKVGHESVIDTKVFRVVRIERYGSFFKLSFRNVNVGHVDVALFFDDRRKFILNFRDLLRTFVMDNNGTDDKSDDKTHEDHEQCRDRISSSASLRYDLFRLYVVPVMIHLHPMPRSIF